MFVEIIPAIRLPRQLKTFTYAVPSDLEADLKIGQIVATTFRNRKIQGVVKGIKKKINFPAKNLKLITKILNPRPLFTPDQFKLAEWLADYYYSSLGLIIKSMIPAVPKRKIKVAEAKIDWNNFSASPRWRFGAAGKKNKSLPIKKLTLLKYSTVKYKNNFLYSLLQNSKKQTLILIPELNNLAKAGQYLNSKLRQKTVIFHSNLNKNQYFNNWQKVISGRAKIIIGTRQAVFMPFKNLGLIIIEAEQDSGFKQSDQNPRYDARLTARELTNLTKAKLLFCSPAPRVEISYDIKNKKIKIIKEPNSEIKTEIINLKNEIKRGNYSLISDRLNQKIVEAKIKGEKVVLYLNRRGISSSVACGDCGYIFNCPHCLVPLPFHQGGKLKCHHCNYQTELTIHCPNCRGVNFKFSGRGTQLLAKELRTIWSGCKILRLDSDTDLKNLTEQQIDSTDIYLGTETVLKQVNWQKVGLVGILLLDNMLYLPNFRANERLWQILKKIATLTTQSRTKKIYLQTFNPENKIFQYFTAQKDGHFYQRELINRQELNYPPFVQIIKLIHQSANQTQAEYLANDLYRKLTTKKNKAKLRVQINEPQLVYTSRVRGRWRYVIIIKAEANIKFLLKIVPENWIIDVDPEDLL